MSDNNVLVLDRLYISKLLPKREQNSSKGTFGTVLNISGSSYYSGAAYLSSIASLKAGAGLCRLASENGVISRLASMSPDITYIGLGENEFGTIPKNSNEYLKNIKEPNSIIIGCGITTLKPVREFVLKFLKERINSITPIIIDADALNILSEENKKPIPLNSVITPHPMELSRLIRVDVNEIQKDRVKWAKYASESLDCIVVLKGKNTVISIPKGNTFINPTGNSALAKGGTGDVLAGMIAGFAAQGIRIEDACLLGCYLHGLAGEIASRELTEYSMLASNLLDFIPRAIKEFV